MNDKLKIEQLWRYLRIQDEVLIIQVYNPDKHSDEYLIAEMANGELAVTTSSELPLDRPFRMIQQRGQDGRHKIPSVEQLINDQEIDY